MHSGYTFLLAGSLLAAMGCSESTSVSGTVEYNGTPVEHGYLSLSATDSGRSYAAPIEEGKYSIPEAEPGQYTVVAIGTKKIDHYSSSAEAYANAGKGGAHVSEAADYIAPDAEGNSQTIEIKSGDQTVDLSITATAKRK